MADIATKSASEGDTFLTFRVGGAWLAAPVGNIDEVAEYADPMPVPPAPPHVRGVFNLRGRALPLLDLEIFLGLPPGPQKPDAGRVVVVHASGMHVGLVCEQVGGLEYIERDALSPPAPSRTPGKAFYLGELRTKDAAAALLDIDALLQAARVRQ